MLRSMTAYGRSCLTTSQGRFTAEIQSINRKHLDIQLNLPPELQRFDADIRKLISSSVTRGLITVKAYAHFEGDGPFVVKVNVPLAQQVKSALDTLASDLKLKDGVTLSMITAFPNVLIHEEQWQEVEKCGATLMDAVRQALAELVERREAEGRALQRDILERVIRLRSNMDQIEKYAPAVTEKLRQKLLVRLEQLVPASTLENEERVIREVALAAERADITEEIVRFRSHLVQADELLEGSQFGVGKTLDFLLQELGREINTIGSKAQEIGISRLVVEVKGELEKIREQVQNIE